MKKNSIAPESGAGTLAAFGAYGIWGVFPIFWKQLKSVDSVQVLGHRFIWAAFFCLAVLLLTGNIGKMAEVFRERRRLFMMIAAAALITVNWGFYIYAVNSGRVIESALGYYINPLISFALGAIFLGETIDRWTWLSIAIAVAGITGAAIVYGTVPWISLVLASSFGFYGFIKKKVKLEPMVSLAVETILVFPFAAIMLCMRHAAGAGSFWNAGPTITALLVLAGIVTAIPLILFAIAANSISLQKMGFIQYLSPTLQLAVGVLIYGERPGPALVTAFVSVAIAVGIHLATRKNA